MDFWKSLHTDIPDSGLLINLFFSVDSEFSLWGQIWIPFKPFNVSPLPIGQLWMFWWKEHELWHQRDKWIDSNLIWDLRKSLFVLLFHVVWWKIQTNRQLTTDRGGGGKMGEGLWEHLVRTSNSNLKEEEKHFGVSGHIIEDPKGEICWIVLDNRKGNERWWEQSRAILCRSRGKGMN